MGVVIVMLFVAYLLGSFPTSYLAGRLLKGIDIRQHGSGNAGATNTFRVIGKIPGICVLIIDIAKGFCAVAVLPILFRPFLTDFLSLPLIKVCLGAAVMSGHIWSCFLQFKGGKGVATGAGVLLGLSPQAVGIGALVWMGIAFMTRFVSLASISACVTIAVYMWLSGAPCEYTAFSILAVTVIILKHLPNIRRLFSHTETKIG